MTRDEFENLIAAEALQGRLHRDTGHICARNILKVIEDAGLAVVPISAPRNIAIGSYSIGHCYNGEDYDMGLTDIGKAQNQKMWQELIEAGRIK